MSFSKTSTGIWQEPKKPIPVIPKERDLQGHVVLTEGEFPKKTIFVYFEYPDCFRRYDGREWVVIEKDKGMDLTVFEILNEGK